LNTKTPRHQDTKTLPKQTSSKAAKPKATPRRETPQTLQPAAGFDSLCFPQLHWTHCHAPSYTSTEVDKRDVTMRLLVVPRHGKTQKKARNVTQGSPSSPKGVHPSGLS